MKKIILALAAFALLLILATTPKSPPAFEKVREATPSSEASLLARDGRLLEKRRTDPNVRRLDWVPLTAISAAVTSRLAASEDKRFADHHGIDWQSVAGALRDRVTRKQSRGASTISMQVAALIDPALGTAGNRSYRQKIMQARAALALERAWAKPQILEASRFMDSNECLTVIPAARGSAGLSSAEVLANLASAGAQFGKNAKAKFQREGEW